MQTEVHQVQAEVHQEEVQETAVQGVEEEDMEQGRGAQEAMDTVEAVTTGVTESAGPHKCKTCEQAFHSKRELRSHITTHHKTFKPCREFANNRCGYDADCWYNHIILDENSHICFKCGKVETTKTLLMKHVKDNHGTIPCLKFRNNTCRFSDANCIFSHTQPHAPRAGVSIAPLNMETDFPQARQAQPPDQTTQIIKKVLSALPVILEQMLPQIIQEVMKQ